MFNPALHEHSDETAIIGLLVAGYTELDIILCSVCGLALGDRNSILNTLHIIRSEQSRIDVANNLAKPHFNKLGLQSKFGEAIGAITHCRKIRNQYAHAQWVGHKNTLHFVHAEKVNFNKKFEDISWKTITIPVLKQQESFFEYTRKCLVWLELHFLQPELDLKWPQHKKRPPLQDRDAVHIHQFL